MVNTTESANAIAAGPGFTATTTFSCTKAEVMATTKMSIIDHLPMNSTTS